MKVLLLGGTGAMGIHLTNILRDSGIDTFVTSRKKLTSYGNVHYLQGDAKDILFLESILQTNIWDAIIDFMVYNTQSFEERINLLLNATKQYIFLSSSRVYADSEESLLESSPRLLDVSHDVGYLSTDEYALTKARQEDILKNSRYKNWTIIRPYITYNEERLQLGVLEKEEWLYRALQGKSIVFSSDILKKETTLTYGFDVARSIAKIIGDKNALSNIFHITAKQNVTWEQVLCVYLNVLEKHLGYKPKVILLELNDFLECKDAKYQVYYDRLYNRRFNNDKISKYIDLDTFIEVENGLKVCLESFLKTPIFNKVSLRSEALKDYYSQEKTLLKDIKEFKSKIKYLIFRYRLKK